MSPSFEIFLRGLQTPNFAPAEVAFRGGNDATLQLNTDPPSEIWYNIVPTLWIAQLARTKIGPIRILSAYRSPAYNSAVGGHSNSLHLKFNALDLQCIDESRNHALHMLLTAWRRAGVFSGGLGAYDWGSHIDTRGIDATWDERS